MEPRPLHREYSLSHWTTREVPVILLYRRHLLQLQPFLLIQETVVVQLCAIDNDLHAEDTDMNIIQSMWC